MKQYDKYRETNIPWLNRLPSHWGEKRAKYLFNKENRLPLEDDEVITCFRDGVVTLRKNRRTTGFTESLKEIGYQGIKKGDLVIHQMDAFAGATGVSDSNGKGTPVYSVCTPKDTNYLTKYYAKVIRLMGLNGFIQSLYRGIRERSSDFRFETFARQLLPVPPLAEQEKVVSYLESKTLCIDAYVAERERELQLLNELKESEIANIITRGLNPDVKMKSYNSLIASAYPEHWELKRNKSFMSLTGYKVGNNANQYTLLSLTTKGVIVRDIESGKGKFPKEFDDYQVVKKDELVFCLFDIDETPRTVGLVNTEGMITGAYTALKVNREYAIPEYIYYYYLCVDNIKALKPYYSGLRKTVRADKFLQLYMPLPPIDEQCAIVSYIEDKCNKINSLITELEGEIEYLKEYKQKLIADCVTGQINVQSEI